MRGGEDACGRQLPVALAGLLFAQRLQWAAEGEAAGDVRAGRHVVQRKERLLHAARALLQALLPLQHHGHALLLPPLQRVQALQQRLIPGGLLLLRESGCRRTRRRRRGLRV